MNFKSYNFLVASSLINILFLTTASYSMAPSLAPTKSTLQWKIINETNNEIKIVVETQPDYIIATVPAHKTVDTRLNLTFFAKPAEPAISLFEIPPKLLFIYVIRCQQGEIREIDNVMILLTSQKINNISDAITAAIENTKKQKKDPSILIEDPSILNKAETILITSDRANRVYEATLTIKGDDLKESTIEIEETGVIDKRLKIMKAIENIAPSLYKILVAADPTGWVDPTGTKYLMQTDAKGKRNIVVNVRPEDGLPLIKFGSYSTEIPQNELEFAIAHELGHYVLGHFKERTSLPKTTKAHQILEYAFNRNQELEADRFAVMKLHRPINDANAWFRRYLVEFKEGELKPEEKTKGTFQRSHPFFNDRINQMKELEREIEAREINWKNLAEDYSKFSGYK